MLVYRITDYADAYHPSHEAIFATHQSALDYCLRQCRNSVAADVLWGIQDGDEYSPEDFRLVVRYNAYHVEWGRARVPTTDVILLVNDYTDRSYTIRPDFIRGLDK